MRGFFALLLLTNAAFLAWQVWGVQKGAAPAPYAGVVMVSDGLQLISELAEERRPQPRELVAVDETAELTKKQESLAEPMLETVVAREQLDDETFSAAGCYQSAPLATLNEARALQEQLRQGGIDNSTRAPQQTRQLNYWVLLRPYESSARADAVAELLRRNQIKDFFVVRTGRHENAISLGVYSSIERAEERVKEVSSQKIRIRKPVIEGLELPEKKIVVRFRLQSEKLPQALIPVLSGTDGYKWQKIPCK